MAPLRYLRRLPKHGLPLVAVLLAGGLTFTPTAEASVVVLENRTDAKIEVALRHADGTASRLSLSAGDVTPLPAPGPIAIGFQADGQPRRYVLQPNSIHYFMSRDKKPELFELPLPGMRRDKPAPRKPDAKGPPPDSPQPPDRPHIIPVMILADDDEPMVRRLWEKKIRQRLAEASDVFEHHCRVRFEVVAVSTWTADKDIRELEKAMDDFERKVRPPPARLAIGFTGRYQWVPGEKHLGGTRGPLHTHILVREALRNMSEPERLEVLVHELGHYLGAIHTLDSASVMRPLLGDRQSRRRGFRIGFDGPNTMAMYLLAEEIRRRPVVGLHQLPPEIKSPLRAVYGMMAKTMTSDDSAARFMTLLDAPPWAALRPSARAQAAVDGARRVVQAVVQAAQQNQGLSERPDKAAGGGGRLFGDELTDCYVRAAAAAARRLPAETAPAALLLGLGVALDNSTLVRDAPLTGRLWRRIESDSERAARLKVLGNPTMRGRHDLAQHFTVSAALVVVVGPEGAEMAGILKEAADAQGGSGFSFLDLAADLAGATFARGVRDGKIPLSALAGSFTVQNYLPELTGLKEAVAWKDFQDAFEGLTGERFQQEVRGIRQRILALPGYKGL